MIWTVSFAVCHLTYGYVQLGKYDELIEMIICCHLMTKKTINVTKVTIKMSFWDHISYNYIPMP